MGEETLGVISEELADIGGDKLDAWLGEHSTIEELEKRCKLPIAVSVTKFQTMICANGWCHSCWVIFQMSLKCLKKYQNPLTKQNLKMLYAALLHEIGRNFLLNKWTTPSTPFYLVCGARYYPSKNRR